MKSEKPRVQRLNIRLGSPLLREEPGVPAAVDSVGDPVDEHGGDEQWDVEQIKQVQYVKLPWGMRPLSGVTRDCKNCTSLLGSE